MEFEMAVERINNIDWDSVGNNTSRELRYYLIEYLRRLCLFYKENKLPYYPPLAGNIARLLGDESDIVISEVCSNKAYECLKNGFKKDIFIFYLQLVKFSQSNPEYKKYLDIYEPAIRIFELGGCVQIRHRELEVLGVFHIELYKEWWKDFSEKEPYDIH